MLLHTLSSWKPKGLTVAFGRWCIFLQGKAVKCHGIDSNTYHSLYDGPDRAKRRFTRSLLVQRIQMVLLFNTHDQRHELSTLYNCPALLTICGVVVVGANTGIGFEAAKHFARMKLVARRSESKGKAAVSEFELATGSKSCEPWTVDLANFCSVVSFAERLQRERDRLETLNHLGTALFKLSLLLLPHLVNTGKKFGSTSRLVTIASEVQYGAILPEEVKGSSNPVTKLNTVDNLLTHTSFNSPNVIFNQKSSPINNPYPRTYPEGFRLRGCFCYSKLRHGERDSEDYMKGAYVSNAGVAEPSDFVISEEGKPMQDDLWGDDGYSVTQTQERVDSTVRGLLQG
ncbi:hypothetical protein L210DRAFT_3504182 [Boletus edulis BED1]|uniref:Uncharacterized protein n=1 Tax=Boletus edulis BED1 TaxID=1328754 RepID=A0AAD4BTB7_BOLED|nr:hypothetical protein L210DRAFT_3504182 [Boletus edulis BED1]